MSDIFYLITSDFWESFLFYLLTLKLDVIDGPARWTNQIKKYRLENQIDKIRLNIRNVIDKIDWIIFIVQID